MGHDRTGILRRRLAGRLDLTDEFVARAGGHAAASVAVDAAKEARIGLARG